MVTTKDEFLSVTLQDGNKLNTFDDYIGNQIHNTKDYYENNILESFREYIPPLAVIYDIGSNIGNHTLYFSKHTNAKTVYSFEPSKETFNLLEKNVKQNQLKDVELFNVGVGENNTRASLVSNKENMGASYLTSSEEGDVEVKSLDQIDLPAPGFIKIDVEGFEHHVLQGAAKLLKETRPVIWVEILEDNYEKVDRLLESFGYIQIDRFNDNFIYINPVNEDELLSYVYFFKDRPLNRFTEKSKETNRKYKFVTSQVSDLKNKLNETNEKYEKVKEQHDNLSRTIQQKQLIDSYENQLEIEQIKNIHLTDISKYKARNAQLETERQSVISLLGGEDIIENIKNLQETNIVNSKVQKAIEDTEKQHQLSVAELEERVVKTNEQNETLVKHKSILTNRLDDALTKLKETRTDLEEKTRQIEELLAQKINLEQDLRDGVLEKVNSLNKEEEFILKLEHEVVGRKRIEQEKEQLNQQYNKLIKKNQDLLKRYSALKNSKLGKLTIGYWKFAKKLTRRGK